MKRHFFIGAVVLSTLVVAMVAMGGDMWILVDVPSLVWVLGVVVGGLWMTCGPGRSLRAIAAGIAPGSRPRKSPLAVEQSDGASLRGNIVVLQQGYQLAWGAGIIGFLVVLAAILNDLSDPARIGAGMAVAVMPMLYGSIVAELLFAPLARRCELAVVEGHAAAADQPAPTLNTGVRSLAMIFVLACLTAFLANYISFEQVRKEDKYQAVVEQISETLDARSSIEAMSEAR